MAERIGGLVPSKWKGNQGRPAKLLGRQKRNILRQPNVHQEAVGNFSVKRVMLKSGIRLSVSAATVRRVMRKIGLKWSHAQKKGVPIKSDLKLILKFAWKVCWKLPKDFWTGGVTFSLDGEIFTQNMNPFDQARAPTAMVWKKPG